MSTLNIKETEALSDAGGRVSAVRTELVGIAAAFSTSDPDRKRLEAMANSLKQAYDQIRTVRALKGHYPS